MAELLAAGVILGLSIVTVLVPAWAIEGTFRRGFVAWAQWMLASLGLVAAGGVLALLWVGVERLLA